MRQRPLCMIFLGLVTVIFIFRTAGFRLWTEPVPPEALIRAAGDREALTLTGRIRARTGKNDKSIYLLSDSEFHSVSLHNISLIVSETESQIAIGSEISVTGRLTFFQHASNPGGFDAKDHYAAEDCYARMTADSVVLLSVPSFSIGEALAQLREKLRERLYELMDPDAAAVLSAMLLGERAGLDSEIRLDYSAAGLSHILAISGFHVSLFGMALYRLLTKLGLRVRPACLAVMAFLVFYSVFTGGSSATVRASVMFAVSLAARCLLRSYDPASALSLSGILILSLRPGQLFRSGFQLSFAAAAALSLLYPLLWKRIRKKGKAGKKARLFEKMRQTFLIWSCLHLVTLPLILWHFYEFPLYSFLINLVFLPLLSMMMFAGAAGALFSLFVPSAARVVLLLPGAVLRLASLTGGFVRRLPAAMIVAGRPELFQMILAGFGVLLLAILLQRSGKLRLCLLPAALILFAAVRLPEGFALTALDVGQGDALVLQADRDTLWLVDGGSSDEAETGRYVLLPYLKSEGITRIEGIFLTHADSDHISGIEQLLEMKAANETALSVGRILIPAWMAEEEKMAHLYDLADLLRIPVETLERGDEIKAGNTRIAVLGPQKGDGLTGNAGSLVLAVSCEGFDALLTGDVEGEGETALLPLLYDFDYLKAAHHGSRNSGTEEFLSRVRPEICVISAPEYSLYGHPHAETIERLSKYGADIYQTGLTGAVRVRVRDGRVLLDTWLRP